MTAPVTRTRRLPFKARGKAYLTYGTRYVPPSDPRHKTYSLESTPSPTCAIDGMEITTSRPHPEWKTRRSGVFSGDLGGDFTSTKTYAYIIGPISSGVSGEIRVNAYQTDFARFTGPIYPMQLSNMVFPNKPLTSETNLAAWGTKAIAKCKPTNPVADAAVFVGELLAGGGIPRRIGSSIETWKPRLESHVNRYNARQVGNEYLNAEFGWKPLVRDIYAFANSITHAERVLAQYERDSGRVVRRRFEFPVETTTSTFDASQPRNPHCEGPTNGALYADVQSGLGKVIRTERTETRRWFSGAFTYHLQTGTSPRETMTRTAQEARKLFGITPTPDALWNLLPWSWAVDWFVSAGDVVSNLSDWATEGLVLKYGYIMEHSLQTNTYAFVGKTGFRNPHYVPPVIVCVTETKRRRKATPFGFGVTWNQFTPRQLAISIALGLKRL